MLKNIVSIIIDKVVGEYVEDLSAADLSISLFRGNVDLRNVKLKPSALDGFDLPVTVVKGTIGELYLEIPWKNLQSKPVVLNLEDVFLVVRPKKCCEWDEHQEREKQKILKEQKILQYEALRTLNQTSRSTPGDEREEQKNSGFWSFFTDADATKSITETIINNLQIHIRNVHLRYEDTSDQTSPFIAGFTLEELSLESCDENWEKKFIHEAGTLAYKLAELKKLAIYMNNSNDLGKHQFSSHDISLENFKEEMKRLITDEKSNQFILQPINGRLQARFQHKGEIDLHTPRYSMDVIFEEVSANLDDLQYRHTLQTIHYMLNYHKFEPFRSMRPAKLNSDDSSSREDWWKFAVQCARKSVRESYFTWDDIHRSREHYTRYIMLFKRKRNVPWLPKLEEDELKEFEELELKLDLEDIVFFRELAEAEISKESEKYAEYKETKKKTSSWFSWFIGGDKEKEEEQLSFQLSEDDRQKLYQSVGYDVQQKAIEGTVPKDYVQLRVNFMLKKGAISLIDAQSRTKIIEAQYADLGAGITLCEDTSRFMVNMALGSFNIFDRFSKDTRFKNILSRRENASIDHSDSTIASNGSLSVHERPLASLKVESNPSEDADLYVGITLDELDFVANVSLIQRILAFVVIASSTVDLSAIEEIARRSLASVQQQAQTQLKLALENKKVVDLDIKIKAPIIILPETCAAVSDTPMIIIDLGHLFIKSDIDIMERKRRLENQEVSESDYYDKFKLGVNNIQIQTSTFFTWSERGIGSNEQLLENVNFDLKLEQCVTPSNNQLPKLKAIGGIPSISFNISVDNIEKLIRIFNSFIVLMNDPTGANKQEMMQVIGPVNSREQKESDEWVDYVVELRESGNIVLYKQMEDRNPVCTISLVNVQIKDLHSAWLGSEIVQERIKKIALSERDYRRIFVILLPQGEKGDDLVFMFRCHEAHIRSTWIGMLKEVAISSRRGTSVGPVPDNILKEEAISDVPQIDDMDIKKKSITRPNILASFHLGTLSAQIQYRQQIISRIALDRLHIEFENRNFDNTLTLTLHKFSVSDLLIPGASEKYIFSSGSDAQTDLARVTLIQAKTGSPKFIDDAETLLKLQFNVLQVFFDPIIISQFVSFGNDLMTAYERISSRTMTFAAITEKADATKEQTSNVDYLRRSASFKVTAHMREALLMLIDSGDTFISFDMKKADVNFLTTPSELRLSATVGDLIVHDHSEQTNYKETLGLNTKDHSLVHFSFEQKKNLQNENDAPFYDKFVNIEMHSVKIVYLQRLITKIQMYITEGPLMDALREGGTRAAKYSIEAVKKQSSNMAMVQMSLNFLSPTVIVPTSYRSANYVIANLGQISVYNRLQNAGSTQDNWIEEYAIQLNEMNLKTNEMGRLIPVVDSVNVGLSVKRSLKADQREIPGLSLLMVSSPVTMKLSQTQYQMIFQIIDNNFNDTLRASCTQNTQQENSSNDADKRVFDHLKTEIFGAGEEQIQQSGQENHDRLPPSGKHSVNQSEFFIEFPHMNLQLMRGTGIRSSGREDPLARLNMYDLKVAYTTKFDQSQRAEVKIHGVNAFDLRSESQSLFKEFISSNSLEEEEEEQQQDHGSGMMRDSEQSKRLDADFIRSQIFRKSARAFSEGPSEEIQIMSSSPSSSMYTPRRQKVDFATFEYNTQGKDTEIYLELGEPRIIFVPDVVTEIKDFFVNRYPQIQVCQTRHIQQRISNNELFFTSQPDLNITTDTWLGENIRLDSERSMHIRHNSTGESTVFGEGKTIFFCPADQDSSAPLIVIEDGMTLRLKSMRLVYVGELMKYIQIGKSSRFIATLTQGVVHEKLDTMEDLQRVMNSSIHGDRRNVDNHMQAAVGNVMAAVSHAQSGANKTAQKKKEEIDSENDTRLTFTGKFGRSKLIFPEDATNLHSRFFVVEARLDIGYNRLYDDENGTFHVDGFKAYTELADQSVMKGAPIIESIDFYFDMSEARLTASQTERFINASIDDDLNIRISYQDVLMIKKIVTAYTDPKPNESGEILEDIVDISGDIFVDLDDTTEMTYRRGHDDDDSDDESEFETAWSEVSDEESDDGYATCDEGEDDMDVSKDPSQALIHHSERSSESEMIIGTNEHGAETRSLPLDDSSIELKFQSKKNIISVMVVDDYRGYDIPLLEVQMHAFELWEKDRTEFKSNRLKFLMGSKQLKAELQISVGANFYNLGLAEWEPIIEPYSCRMDFERRLDIGSPIPYVYRADVQSFVKPSIMDSTSPEQEPSTLNVNISRSMIDTIMTTSKLWREGLTSDKPVSVRFDPFTIRNHTKQIITFTKEDQHQSDGMVQLSHGEELGFEFSENQRRTSKSAWRKELFVHIKIPDFPSTRVNVRHVDSTMILSEQQKKFAMIEVEQIEGRKIITVRSGIKILNNTTIPWNLALSSNGNLVPFGTVQPQETFGVPICDVNNERLCIQPAETSGQYKWSDAITSFTLSEIMISTQRSRQFECTSSDQSMDGRSRSFHCVARTRPKKPIDDRILHLAHDTPDGVTLLQQFDFTIQLLPPLSVENLLGCSIDYVLFEKVTMNMSKKRVMGGTLARGEKVYFYRGNLKNNILFRVKMQNPKWKTEKIALVHSNEDPSQLLTQRLALHDDHDKSFYLHFDYHHNVEDAFRKVLIYCPYWIKNHTGQSLAIQVNGEPAAGQSLFDTLSTTDPFRKAEPMMFSFKDSSRQNKISIAVNDSKFSRGFSIDNAGMPGDIELVKDNQVYNIGYYVAIGPGKFKRTKIVTFAARYVIVNRADEIIQFRQTSAPHVKTLHPGEKSHFYWWAPNKKRSSRESRMLSINVDEVQFEWSSAFRVDVLGVTPLKLLPKRGDSPKILNVDITMQQGTVFIIIEKPDKPPYIIENMLSSDIEFSQVSTNTWWTLSAGSKVPFVWDDNTRTQKLRLRILNGFTVPKPIAINRVAKEEKIRMKNGSYLYISVRARGPTRVLRISEIKGITSGDRDTVEYTSIEFEAVIHRIGISFINSVPLSEEIAYLFFEGFYFSFRATDKNQSVMALLSRLQLDNMSNNTQHPVTLTNVMEGQDFIRLFVERSLTDKTINRFRQFSFSMQEANLAIDYSFFSKLSLYLENIFKSSDKEDQDAADKMLQSVDDASLDPSDSDKSTTVYFDEFKLHPIKVNLTFKLTHTESDSLTKNPLFLILNNIGITLANVDDAPLKLNSLILKHPFMTTDQLLDRIKKHYTTAVLSEIYKIVGSFDIIGNPIGLVNDLSTGLKDFFYEPATAIQKSPAEFRAGVIRGTSSLFSNSLHGTFNTASKMTGSMGNALGLLAFDSEYRKKREQFSNKKATNIREGLSEGASAAAKGIFDGVTGLFVKPIEGASKAGTEGFLKGVGIGIIGIPVKPVTGFFDLVTKTTEGISNLRRENKGRVRLGRVFREDGAVIPYSPSAAFAHHMLTKVSEKYSQEYPVCFCRNENRTVAILTNRSIFNVNHVNYVLDWKVDVDGIESVTRDGPMCLKIRVHATRTTKHKHKLKLFRSSQTKTSFLERKIVFDEQEMRDDQRKQYHEALDEFQRMLYQRIDECKRQIQTGVSDENSLLIFEDTVFENDDEKSPRGGKSPRSPKSKASPRRLSLRGLLQRNSPRTSSRDGSPRR